MGKRVRIIDIAKKAGVSKGTVDRVIHKRGNVAPNVLQRVQAVMEELDYRPNIIASALASNKTWRIATLLPNPAEDLFWEHPDNGIKHATDMVRDYGMTVDVYHFEDENAAAFAKEGAKILKKDYDGVLVAPIYFNEAHGFLNKCQAQNLPYGLINTYIERQDDQCLFYLGQDSYHSGMLGAKLLNFGIANQEAVMVLHLEKGIYASRHLLEKEQGFQNFFIEHPKRDIQVIKTSFDHPADTAAFSRFIHLQLQSYPSLRGIFVTTSKIHYLSKALDRLKETRLKLVGFDLIEENIKCLNEEKVDFLINQNPFRQGHQGILNFFNYLVRKNKLAMLQNLPLDVVMKENANYYLRAEDHVPFLV